MKRYILILLGLLSCMTLSQCGGGSDDSASTFTMSAQSFVKNRKEFIFANSSGTVRVHTTQSWYHDNTIGPDVDASIDSGYAECSVLLSYSPDTTGANPPSALAGLPGSARYYVRKDGTANLEIACNSNSGGGSTLENIAAVLIGLIKDNDTGSLQVLDADLTIGFTGEAAGSWYSYGDVNATGNPYMGGFRLIRD